MRRASVRCCLRGDCYILPRAFVGRSSEKSQAISRGSHRPRSCRSSVTMRPSEPSRAGRRAWLRSISASSLDSTRSLPGSQWICSETSSTGGSAPARGSCAMSACLPVRPVATWMTGLPLLRKLHRILQVEVANLFDGPKTQDTSSASIVLTRWQPVIPLASTFEAGSRQTLDTTAGDTSAPPASAGPPPVPAALLPARIYH
jgi:hypothetical protein